MEFEEAATIAMYPYSILLLKRVREAVSVQCRVAGRSTALRFPNKLEAMESKR